MHRRPTFRLLLLLVFTTAQAGAQPQDFDGLFNPETSPESSAVFLTLPEPEEAVPAINYVFSREDFNNPVVEIRTSMGTMVLELFPEEAPLAVANFMDLAEGDKPWTDPYSGLDVIRPFYDGLTFHRVIDGFMIQSGSPTGLADGNPGFTFRDEINARSLGLDKMQALDSAGKPHPLLGIQDEATFREKMLAPLYEKMQITSRAELETRIDEVNTALHAMTVMEGLENLGYRFNERYLSRMPVRGVIAMANSGPDSNGSQFFITLTDTDWLAGRYTVFGKVRVGLDVLDAVGKVPVDANNRPLQDVTILSVRQIPL